MKAAFLILALLLVHSPVWAAFASVGTLGTANSITNDVTLALTTTAQLDAGNLGVCLAAKDNDVATTDTETSEYTSITDSGSNTWTKLKEFSNGQATENTGTIGAIFYSRVTTNVASGGTITLNLSSTTQTKAMTCWEFTVGANVQVAGTVQTSASDGLDAPAQTIGSLTSKEYLFIRLHAETSRNSTFVAVTSGYTQIPVAIADNGAGTLSQQAQGEFRIFTGTGDTSDPDSAGTGVAVNIYGALEEQGAAAPRRPVAPIIFQ